MPALRRRTLLLAGAAVAAATAARAQPALRAGRDFEAIKPVRPLAPAGRIEVIEFFWYGCPHCADMHPRLEAWAKQLPADVQLLRLPVVFSASWEVGARLHHTLQALGEAERLAGAVFEATQLDELDFKQGAVLQKWVRDQGLDPARFNAAWASPEVRAQVAQARGLADRYQLSGVPAFVVDGRFLTSNRYTGNADTTLEVVSALVQRVRAEREGREGRRAPR